MNHTNEIMLWGRGGTLGTEGRSAGSYNELNLSVWDGTKWREPGIIFKSMNYGTNCLASRPRSASG